MRIAGIGSLQRGVGGALTVCAVVLAGGVATAEAAPALQKTFTPANVSVGETTTLNFAINNPDATTQAWSFTDQLADALHVAQSTPVSNTCTGSTVSAPLDGQQVTISGSLGAGASCAVGIKVQVTETGTHVNSSGNITQRTNITGPGLPAQVQCSDPAAPPVDDIIGVFVDCEFSDEPPPSNFTIQEDWHSVPNTVAYQTPVVGDLFGTGDPVVVAGGGRSATGGNPVSSRVARDIHIYDGDDGSVLYTITTPRYTWSSFAAVAIADVNSDGRGEIIFRAASHSQTQADADAVGVASPSQVDGRLIAYEYNPVTDDWDVMWISDQRYDHGPNSTQVQARGGASVSLADFNADGTPEVYVGNQIFNAVTGVRLASGAASQPSGCQVGVSCLLAQTVAFDRDGDGDLELAAGYVIYDVQINDTTAEAPNSMTVAETADLPSLVNRDGFTAVADLDLDGSPEVVVTIAGNNTVIYAWDSQTGALKDQKLGTQLAGGTGAGPPMIGDIDGDGRPEIVMVTVNRVRALKYIPGVGFQQAWIIATVDSSGGTSMSMFDFNNDGKQEIVYRDEQNIRIMDGGPSPANANRNLATFSCGSGTSVDMPVIADITGSGEARIVVTCEAPGGSEVRAYESASFDWANTRPVWNQQAYFVTHINDDLTVPSGQFPNWTVFSDPQQRCSDGANRPLNSFQVQTTDLDDDTGCPVACVAASLEVDKASNPASGTIVEPGDTIDYTITIENTVNDPVPDVDVSDDLSDILDDATITSGPTVNPGAAGTAQITGNTLNFLGTIPGNGTVTITYEATVNAPGQLGNGNLGNAVVGELSNCDGASATLRCTTEHPVAALRLQKAAGVALASVGDVVNYTFTLTNTGSLPLTGVGVNDPLPGMSTPVCAQANLAPGANTTCSASRTVTNADAAAGQIENTATANAGYAGGGQVTSNQASATVQVNARSELSITKTAPLVAFVGDTFEYVITVKNTGPNDSNPTTVTDVLPSGVSFQFAPGACTVSPGPAPQTVVCNIGNVASGATEVVTMFVKVEPAAQGSLLHNVATVDGPNQDTNPADDTDDADTVVPPAADLKITKDATPAVQNVGSNVSYLLTVTNDGPTSSPTTTVTDDLPPGFSLVSATPSQGMCGNADPVVCQLGFMSNGATETITIVAQVGAPDGRVAINTASVTGAIFDPNLDNNTDDAQTQIPPLSDLEIEKTATETSVHPGETIQYTLAVSNGGPTDSNPTIVTDDLPASLTGPVQATSSQGPGCTVSPGGQISCNLGNLPANGPAATITVVATVANNASGEIVNTAEVDGPNPDPDPTNNSSTERTPIEPDADLEIVKTDGPDPVDVGEDLTYTLDVRNLGPSPATEVEVTDDLPPGLTLVSATSDQGACSTTDPVTCDVGDLAVGGTAQITIVARVGASLGGTQITNTASVDGAEDDTFLPNNSDPATTTIPVAADLRITKEADPSPIEAGEDVTYTLTVTNDGPNTATAVTVDDDLPNSLTLVSATPSQGNCNNSDPVQCALGTLLNGASATVEIVATVGTGQTGNVISNTATVEAAEHDPDPDDNSATEPTEVLPEADLAIDKRVVEPAPYLAGENTTYLLTVTNNGPNLAEEVDVTDDLPAGLTLVSATPSKGDCLAGDPLTCGLGNLAAGESTEIRVVVTIGADRSAEQIVNAASVDSDTLDQVLPNNEDAATIAVEPEADLSVSKTTSASTAVSGENITWTITVHNAGPEPATQAELSDDLPAELTLVSASPSQGACNAADPLVCQLGVIPVGATVTVEVVTQINELAADAPITNSAFVESAEHDPSTPNNSNAAVLSARAAPPATERRIHYSLRFRYVDKHDEAFVVARVFCHSPGCDLDGRGRIRILPYARAADGRTKLQKFELGEAKESYEYTRGRVSAGTLAFPVKPADARKVQAALAAGARGKIRADVTVFGSNSIYPQATKRRFRDIKLFAVLQGTG